MWFRGFFDDGGFVKITRTRNRLPKKTRIEITKELQERLADSIDLMIQARQAHWSVKSLNFIALHELFDRVYTDTGTHVDIIAERIAQLGGIAQRPNSGAAKKFSLREYPPDIPPGSMDVAELAHAIAYFGKQIQKGIELCTRLKDTDTAAILAQVSRGADVNLWSVEAHEQAAH